MKLYKKKIQQDDLEINLLMEQIKEKELLIENITNLKDKLIQSHDKVNEIINRMDGYLTSSEPKRNS